MSSTRRVSRPSSPSSPPGDRAQQRRAVLVRQRREREAGAPSSAVSGERLVTITAHPAPGGQQRPYLRGVRGVVEHHQGAGRREHRPEQRGGRVRVFGDPARLRTEVAQQRGERLARGEGGHSGRGAVQVDVQLPVGETFRAGRARRAAASALLPTPAIPLMTTTTAGRSPSAPGRARASRTSPRPVKWAGGGGSWAGRGGGRGSWAGSAAGRRGPARGRPPGGRIRTGLGRGPLRRPRGSPAPSSRRSCPSRRISRCASRTADPARRRAPRPGGPQRPVDGQGLGLASGAVQDEHQLPVEGLSRGCSARAANSARARPVGRLEGAASGPGPEAQLRPRTATPGRAAAPPEPLDERVGCRRRVVQPAQRRTAPQCERRRAASRSDGGPVASGVRGAGGRDVGLEDTASSSPRRPAAGTRGTRPAAAPARRGAAAAGSRGSGARPARTRAASSPHSASLSSSTETTRFGPSSSATSRARILPLPIDRASPSASYTTGGPSSPNRSPYRIAPPHCLSARPPRPHPVATSRLPATTSRRPTPGSLSNRWSHVSDPLARPDGIASSDLARRRARMTRNSGECRRRGRIRGHRGPGRRR